MSDRPHFPDPDASATALMEAHNAELVEALADAHKEAKAWQAQLEDALTALNAMVAPTIQEMVDKAWLSDANTRRLLLRRPLSGEVTEKMVKAGCDAWMECHKEGSTDPVFEAVYRAMLDAHPANERKAA